MIDTHCHLTYDGLHERIDDVLAAAAAAGVDRMVSVGTSPNDAGKAAALAERYPNVYATAGLHPHYAGNVTDHAALRESLRQSLEHPRVVALGEMGLDRHYPDPPMAQQRAAFATQLGLFNESPDVPGIVHNREATDDTLAMLADHGVDASRLVFHCFTGTPAEAERILDTGAWVSFTGIVTFGSAKRVAEASDLVPLERLMIETDSPYLTPAPHRKVRPNEPRYVACVAEFLARRRGMGPDDFVAAVDANAERFFGW
ncbi:MAG: TatD family hydrolase [Planctomycetota bacterium]